jgi:hypothetical protein
MPDAPSGNRLIAAIKDLWKGLRGAPNSLWAGSIFVLVIGGVLILASKIPSPFGWERHEPAELARDIGIALIIAPVVTIVYEAGTRRSAKFEQMRHDVIATLASLVTEDIFEEIKDQIVMRNRTRRDVEITVSVLRAVELADGTRKAVPDNMVVLEIEYAYNLHRFRAAGQIVEVNHALDIHMWDEALQVPCFKWIDIIVEGQTTRYDKDKLAASYNRAKGLFSNNVHVPEGGSVRIISNRLENIFVPGMYTLFMPEILTRDEGAQPDAITIHLTIENLPEDLEASATTWYAPHELARVGTANEWVFRRPMFAGQGISLILKKRAISAESETPKPLPASVAASSPGEKPGSPGRGPE